MKIDFSVCGEGFQLAKLAFTLLLFCVCAWKDGQLPVVMRQQAHRWKWPKLQRCGLEACQLPERTARTNSGLHDVDVHFLISLSPQLNFLLLLTEGI